MKKIYILGAMVCGLAACKPNIEPTAPERGDANFTSYVSVGSSHTAGITNGSYYLEGQLNSYPNILSQQFATVGGGQFVQPLVPGEHGWPMPKFVLDFVQGECDTIPILEATDFKGALDTVGTGRSIYNEQGPFNNMGIPGTKVSDYGTFGFGTQNMYAARIFKDPTGSKPLLELQVPALTFFTIWLGMDDVLDYALAGGETGATPDVRNTITPTNTFRVAYDSLINVLTRNGAKGVALNIPDILEMPYFRAHSPRGLVLDAKDANRLNLMYNATQTHFDEGNNYYVIEDKEHPDGHRQIRAGEIVRLDIPRDSILCAGWGTDVPIPDTWVLTMDEIEKVNAAIDAFNSIIAATANDYNIPVSDTRYVLNKIQDGGEQFNGVNFSYQYAYGNLFSLDGIHLTGRGNAMLANSIIHTINGYYQASIPLADVNKFSTNQLP